jgi:uncharacterized protein (DUF1697 family)
MTTFLALLRGINVGKGNRLPMAELRALLEELGKVDVSTLLNSGNAVFRARSRSSAPQAQALHDALVESMDLDVPVIVKSEAELQTIVDENPLADRIADPSRFLFGFVQDPRSLKELRALEDLAQPPSAFVVGKHAAYLQCPDGVLQSEVGKALLGRAGRQVTTRNEKTVQKILSRMREVHRGG